MKEKILTKILAVFFIMIVAVSGAMAISLTKSQTDSLIPTYVGEVITDKQVYYQGDNIQIKWSLAERFNNYMKLIKLVNVETGASINLIQDNEVLGTNYAKATIPNWLPEGYWKVRVTIQPEVEGQTYWDSKDFKVVKKELTLIKIVGLGEAFELRKNGQATLQGTGFTMTLNRLGPLIVCVRAPCDSYPEASITAQIQKPSTANNVAGVSVDINMAVGETKDLFGYTITFEKSDGTVGVFIINKGITQPPVPG
ncbi:MAG: hypothetical protein KJ583_07755, partial [Nanoarchaeota archaeon]|nr:hypothetical protein [Nanoarchaeota archaeon]MBU1605181.1 hypothetical protein [Nanoarchaeota archaeon]